MNRSGPRRLAAAALACFIAVVAAVDLTGCVAYEPMPAYPSTVDRSWDAALGAMQDQGVTIRDQDRASGTIRGQRGEIAVTTFVRTQADGRVRVEFNTTGGGSDNTLAERIRASYERRMGR